MPVVDPRKQSVQMHGPMPLGHIQPQEALKAPLKERLGEAIDRLRGRPLAGSDQDRPVVDDLHVSSLDTEAVIARVVSSNVDHARAPKAWVMPRDRARQRHPSETSGLGGVGEDHSVANHGCQVAGEQEIGKGPLQEPVSLLRCARDQDLRQGARLEGVQTP